MLMDVSVGCQFPVEVASSVVLVELLLPCLSILNGEASAAEACFLTR